MKTPAFLLLAALMAASTAVPAKGLKIRSGGSHANTSHSTPHAEPATVRAPRGHGGSGDEQQQVAANAEAQRSTAMNDRLNAELAAQRAATPPGPPVGQVVAQVPVAEPVQLAANEHRLTRPVTVGKVADLSKPIAADITALVPKDSMRPPADDYRRNDRFNRQGVNCSLYPSRC